MQHLSIHSSTQRRALTINLIVVLTSLRHWSASHLGLVLLAWSLAVPLARGATIDTPGAAPANPTLDQIAAGLGEWLGEPTPSIPGPGPDSTLFLSYDPLSENFVLARQEAAQSDDASGTTLADAVTLARPAISGDGSLALFVNTDYDLCMVRTAEPTSRRCLGLPGRFYSVALSKDAQLVALVLQDPQTGDPEDKIIVFNRTENHFRIYKLALPVTDDATAEAVFYADFMNFNSDGTVLFYDALYRVKFGNEPGVECWSVSSLNLETGNASMIAPPIKGLNTGNPSASRTSNRFVAFDARHQATGTSTILVVNLATGQTTKVGTVEDGYGFPTFASDDSAIIYAAADGKAAGGISLFKQDLGADRQPSGEPSVWLPDALLGVLYRRAIAETDNALPTVTFKLSADRITAPGPVTLTATAADSDGSIARVEFYNGSNKLGQTESAPYTFVWHNVPAGNHLLTARAIDNRGGVSESSPRLLSVRNSTTQGTQASFSIRSKGKDKVGLTVHGQPGNYIISISQDLSEWSDLYPVTVDASGVGSVDDSGGPMNFSCLFYRVRKVAD